MGVTVPPSILGRTTWVLVCQTYESTLHLAIINDLEVYDAVILVDLAIEDHGWIT